jgi:hypothetical protein
MEYRYVVLDRGLDSNVYKIPLHHTARLENERGPERMDVFENFHDAQKAALRIVSRYGEAARKRAHSFSVRRDPRLESVKSQISQLTEEGVETYFL